MKFEKLLKIVSEQNSFNYKTITGYHGSDSKKFSLNPEKEIWFALDRGSQILDYYSGRGSLIQAELNLGNCLDLSMYDTDDLLGSEEIRSFLIDCELSDQKIDYWTDITIEGMRRDNIMLTNILNNLIKFEWLSSKIFDSIFIKEYSYDTVCMLNTSLINNIQIIKSNET